MNKHYRPEVKQISKQWVRENCRYVTERDMGLLRILHENNRRILRRDQIQVLYPMFPSIDRLNKRLKALYELYLIDRIYPSAGIGNGSSQQHICLDRAGIILLDPDKHITKPISEVNGIKCLPLGWEHKVKINDYECQLISLCDELGADMKLYTPETPVTFGDTRMIPDILCLIVCKGRGYVFFVEVDLGTEDIPYVKKKFDTYVDYYMSRVWVNENWSRVFRKPTFPRVLFFTEDGKTKRIKSLEEYSKESSVKFVIGSHQEFSETIKSIING